MRPRELKHDPLKLLVYVCLGCARTSYPGRDGLGRCSMTEACGTYVRVEVRPVDEAMQAHLWKAKRHGEKVLHERMVENDRLAAEATKNGKKVTA